MSRSRIGVVLVSLVAGLSLLTACGGSSEEDAKTPEGSPTVANSALQTNSKGETVTAPSSTPPATTGAGEKPPAAAGDAAAGETYFAASCAGCHLNGGKDAGGVGPVLAGAGLTAEAVETQIINGKGAMPGGLASGADLDNVVAYVVSLQ